MLLHAAEPCGNNSAVCNNSPHVWANRPGILNALDWLTCSWSFPCTHTVQAGGDSAEIDAAVVIGDIVGAGGVGANGARLFVGAIVKSGADLAWLGLTTTAKMANTRQQGMMRRIKPDKSVETALSLKQVIDDLWRKRQRFFLWRCSDFKWLRLAFDWVYGRRKSVTWEKEVLSSGNELLNYSKVSLSFPAVFFVMYSVVTNEEIEKDL